MEADTITMDIISVVTIVSIITATDTLPIVIIMEFALIIMREVTAPEQIYPAAYFTDIAMAIIICQIPIVLIYINIYN